MNATDYEELKCSACNKTTMEVLPTSPPETDADAENAMKFTARCYCKYCGNEAGVLTVWVQGGKVWKHK